MKIAKAVAILGIGFIMTFLLFPWMDHLKPTYRPVTLVLCDSVNTGDNTQLAISGDYWGLQEFTAGSSYKLCQIKLKVWLEGAGTGTMEARMYAADALGEPTGATLGFGTLLASTMNASSPGDYEIIKILPYPVITSGQDYVIVATYTPTASEWVNWRVDCESSSGFAYSDDAGDTWTHGDIPGGCSP
jgi:hypothetical protein